MKIRLELTLAEAEELYRSAADFPTSDPQEFIRQRGKRVYSNICTALDKLNQAKRCFVFHRQVKEGRDMHGAQPIGTQNDGEGTRLELFNCPTCRTTVSRKVKS